MGNGFGDGRDVDVSCGGANGESMVVSKGAVVACGGSRTPLDVVGAEADTSIVDRVVEGSGDGAGALELPMVLVMIALDVVCDDNGAADDFQPWLANCSILRD